jgi:nucleoid-associated protein EbfC
MEKSSINMGTGRNLTFFLYERTISRTALSFFVVPARAWVLKKSEVTSRPRTKEKNMNNMMKQAQMLQKKMLKAQEELATRTVEASAGGGMVKVVATGSQKIESIVLEKEVVDPEDVEMLQDLVMAAVNDALKKSQEMVSAEMGKLTGGLNIPGL